MHIPKPLWLVGASRGFILVLVGLGLVQFFVGFSLVLFSFVVVVVIRLFFSSFPSISTVCFKWLDYVLGPC